MISPNNLTLFFLSLSLLMNIVDDAKKKMRELLFERKIKIRLKVKKLKTMEKWRELFLFFLRKRLF